MKKTIGLFSVLAIFTIVSCNNEPETTKETKVIVVPEAKKEKVVVVPEPKKEEEKPTSITIDKGGVEVESKKVKVKVKPNN
jgi:hypothetical protein